MKTEKKSVLILCLCFAMVLIGWSPVSEITSSENTTDEVLTLKTFEEPNITLSAINEIVKLRVVYVPGTTEYKKNKIRSKYTLSGLIVSVDENYFSSPDIDLWHVNSNCSAQDTCKPKVYSPNDPDIESSTISN